MNTLHCHMFLRLSVKDDAVPKGQTLRPQLIERRPLATQFPHHTISKLLRIQGGKLPEGITVPFADSVGDPGEPHALGASVQTLEVQSQNWFLRVERV